MHEPIQDALADLRKDIVEAFEDLCNVLTKGELKRAFKLVDFLIFLDENLACDSCLGDGNSLRVSKFIGSAVVRSDLCVRIKVSTSN